MTLIDCPACGSALAPTAATCPRCGATRTTPTVAAQSGVWSGVKIGLGMCIVLPLLLVGGCMVCSGLFTATVTTALLDSFGCTRQRWVHADVNVRAGRSTAYDVVTQLERGDSVCVDSLVNGWYLVVRNDDTLGYSAASLLQFTRPE